jgi:hypothetical protein
VDESLSTPRFPISVYFKVRFAAVMDGSLLDGLLRF